MIINIKIKPLFNINLFIFLSKTKKKKQLERKIDKNRNFIQCRTARDLKEPSYLAECLFFVFFYVHIAHKPNFIILFNLLLKSVVLSWNN